MRQRSITFLLFALGVLLLAPVFAWAADSMPARTESQTKESAVAVSDLVWPQPPQQARIRYLGSVATPEDIGHKAGFWGKLWNFIRGEEEGEKMTRPMAVAVDSRDRLLVADAKTGRVHIFDRGKGDYDYLSGSGQQSMRLPIGLAVDDRDYIYVADGELAGIFVFRPDGKFDHMLDSAAWLKRPSALAIDQKRRLLYVVDVPSHDVKIIDLATEKVSNVIGRRGEGRGEFNYPVFATLDRKGNLAVTDSMNMRIQVFDTKGKLISVFGKQGDGSGSFAAPKGVAFDSEGHVYVADAVFDNIQVFDSSGRLLLYWGTAGQDAGKFWLPTGLFIDERDRIYVADSYNNRVQIFQYLKVQNAR